MKPMIWHPDEGDEHVNQYLSKINHAPYAIILGLLLGLFLLLTLFFLLGPF